MLERNSLPVDEHVEIAKGSDHDSVTADSRQRLHRSKGGFRQDLLCLLFRPVLRLRETVRNILIENTAAAVFLFRRAQRLLSLIEQPVKIRRFGRSARRAYTAADAYSGFRFDGESRLYCPQPLFKDCASRFAFKKHIECVTVTSCTELLFLDEDAQCPCGLYEKPVSEIKTLFLIELPEGIQI